MKLKKDNHNFLLGNWFRSIFIFSLILVFFLKTAIPQIATPTDSTTLGDTTTTLKKLPMPPRSGMEGPVKYWADNIYFSLPTQTTHLERNVRIEYQTITLTAGKVEIDWQDNSLTAVGVVDSTDSLGNPVYKDLPVLTEKGNEPIKGFRLEYNFRTRRGKIFQARTKMEPGYYSGKEIKKVGKETLFIRGGCFTTCDLENPHYYFCSSKMRVKVKKVGVAKPIVMYIAGVPVMAVPFGVFPLQRGRRSGIILPTYGINNWGGRYLERFGYYWAASDYWDASVLANFYEKTGMVYWGELRYAKRYNFSGNINGRYAPRDVLTGVQRQRWMISFNHSQRVGQTMSVYASGSFQSDKDFRRQYFNDINERLNQSLSTNLVIRKSWPGSRNSLSLSMRRTENLQTGQTDYEIPNLTFSQPSRSLIPFKANKQRQPSWYNDIKYSYNTNLISRGSRTPKIDTSGQTSFKKTTKSGWKHNLNISFTRKIFRYISTHEFLNFEELWVPEYQNYTWVDSLNTTVSETVKGFRSRHTFNMGLSANTTFYGLWEIPLLPIHIIRHKVDPFISFSYTPDFSNPRYGYVQTFRDTTGRVVKKDRFAGGIFGGTTTRAIKRLNMGVRNFFQGKIISDGQEKKINLFRLNFNTSYDFLADSLKWGNVHTSLTAQPHRDFNLSLSASHTFYQPTSSGSGRRNAFVWEDGFRLPRLLNLQINARFHLSPPKKKEKTKTSADTTTLDQSQVTPAGYQRDITRDRTLDALRGFRLPWDLNLSFTYNLNKFNVNNPSKTFNVNASARVELTQNWRIQYNARFDLIQKNINFQSFSIYRDLHCWEMYFSWQPNSVFSSFRLEIRIKASALRDIKLTKTSGGRTAF